MRTKQPGILGCKTVHLAALAAILLAGSVLPSVAQSKPRAKTPAKIASNNKAVAPAPATGPQKCNGKNGLSPAEIDELLAAHNRARAELNVVPVTWDCKLADLAQEWATRGKFEHRENFIYGENMFVSSNTAEPIATAVNRWLTEKRDWNNTAAACAAGKVCTHYTQTVWKKTARIGCGINRAGTDKWRTIVVCNYDPASLSSGPAY